MPVMNVLTQARLRRNPPYLYFANKIKSHNQELSKKAVTATP
jgi:hypothetical protein